MRLMVVLGAAAVVAVAVPVQAQVEALRDVQAQQGEAIVQQWCSNCHAANVAGRGTDVVPTLKQIAETRSADYVRGFLMNPHTAMPDVGLSTREIEAIVAYFESLRDGGLAER